MDHTIIKEAATKIVANIKAMEDDITVLQNKQDIISTSDTTMTGSYPGRLSIEEIGGKCEQASTTGKNLCPTFERNVNSDSHFSDKIYVKGNTIYVLSFVKERIPGATMTNQGLHQCSYDEYNSSGSKISTITTNPITLPSGSAYCEHVIKTNVNTSFIVVNFTNNNNDTNINTKVYNVQVEEGSVATPYEPYTGGQPSPNPDYPQEIKKTVVSEIKTHGKNLLDCRGLTESTIRNVKFTPVYDDFGNLQYIEANGTPDENYNYAVYSIPTSLIVGKKYTLNGCPTGGGVATYAVQINFFGSDYGSGVTAEVTDETNMRVDLFVMKGYTANKLRFYPMICKEDIVDSTYEPYTESTITLSQPIELYGIGDVQDTIEDGKVVRRFAEIVFNGLESLALQTNTPPGGYYFLYDNDSVKRGTDNNKKPNWFCNRLPISTPNNIYGVNEDGISTSDKGSQVRFRMTSLSSVASTDSLQAQLKDWYNTGDPMTVVYELAAPVIEELPLVDQMALNSLKTFDNITYVDTDSEIEPTFQFKYGASKIGGYTLEGILAGANGVSLGQSNTDRITALEATLVNNI